MLSTSANEFKIGTLFSSSCRKNCPSVEMKRADSPNLLLRHLTNKTMPTETPFIQKPLENLKFKYLPIVAGYILIFNGNINSPLRIKKEMSICS